MADAVFTALPRAEICRETNSFVRKNRRFVFAQRETSRRHLWIEVSFMVGIWIAGVQMSVVRWDADATFEKSDLTINILNNSLVNMIVFQNCRAGARPIRDTGTGLVEEE
jgi:hypothetical protein